MCPPFLFGVIPTYGVLPYAMIHDGSNEFSTALCQLKVLACQNNFAIHDVPYDGNCMFSAVSYQLQTTGVCNVESSDLRQKVADHLEANACTFVLSLPIPTCVL